MQMHSRVWIFLSILFITGCGPSSSGGKGNAAGIEPGKSYETIRCKKSPAHTYAIYLPSAYKPGSLLPVILAFDPDGSGMLPVSLYKDLAEKYGFILIGSNDSRNGQDSHQTEEIISALLQEATGRYGADPNRIYCTGFSGGSRVAALIAFYRGGIKGVTGCGAGFPSIQAPVNHLADYYGMVGDQDFNYVEMADLAIQFSRQPFRSTLQIFHGPHAWPPAIAYEASIRWHWTNAMHDGLIPQEPFMISETEKEVQENSQALQSIDTLVLEQERRRHQFYAESMQEKPVSWWKQEITKLEHPAHPADSLLDKRLLSHIGILAYSFSNKALAAGNKAELTRMIGVYELVEPENSYIPKLKEQLNQLP